ncbi:HU family DNA-binding protein [Paraburkholderia sp. UCT31]|uniref:HU family DNA-binding protein n=1 Tax=Paraburkholderia sp. UCT31 TaxID=2615209 RepID=UPI001655367E|nr:HU family DNA-binding protein [Paraburkholderia sp. UCT31]MBC8737126.1 HU family DNA-binding protein [Paraburkholderia sp. UCT31]
MTTKTEFVERVAEKLNKPKTHVSEVLDSILETVRDEVAAGNDVTFVGFGAFSQGERAERQGRNPSTGETITIAAAKTVKFSAGKAFKDQVNGGK